MFILSRLEEHFRVAPQNLAQPRRAAISAVINATLLDRIVHDLGLCISLYDIESVETGIVYPNDGGVWFKVKFRMVIFRPFISQICIAKIKAQSTEGLQLTLGFFDDVFIPEHFLPEPSFYDEQEGVWFWNYTNEEGETNQMYMELDEDARFRVTSIRFNPAPSQDEIRHRRELDAHFGSAEKPFPLMEVFGEISTTGLGPLTWWKSPDENDNADRQLSQ